MSVELVPLPQKYMGGSSRFRRWEMVQDGGEERFFATYYSHAYPYSPEDRYHEVGAGEEGRLDYLAHLYYGSSLLWWVLAECNEIFNPFTEVVSGVVLRIPSISYVMGTRLA